MSSQSWQKSTSITQHLQEQTPDYNFIQAVRLLERSRYFDEIHISGKNIAVAKYIPPENEVIRFHVNQKLEFYSSDINSVYKNKNGINSKQWHLLVNLIGLTGSEGVLPYHYTELILQRLKLKDNSIRDFFDLFNHRTVSLFFQASVKYKLPIEYERKRLSAKDTTDKDIYTQSFLSLLGLGTKHLGNRLHTEDESLIYYSGLFSQQIKTSSGLKQILQRHFSIPVDIQEFVGQWQDLIDDVRTRLASKQAPKGQNACLGRSAILGKKGWDAQGKIRIVLGPMNSAQLKRFAPGTTTLKALNEIVRLYSGIECNYDFIIQVKEKDIPSKLELSKHNRPIVGWNTWLPKSTANKNPDKTVDIVVSPARLQ